MNPESPINCRVEVIASYHHDRDVSQICMPHKMRWNGQEITFTELGMRHPTAKGQRMIHVFDMSDGVNNYRLEFDAEGLTWTLIAMIDGSKL